MIQTQLLDLVPNLQAATMPPTKNGVNRNTQAGMFEHVMKLGVMRQNSPVAGVDAKGENPRTSQTAGDNPGMPDAPADICPKPRPEDKPDNLYILAPVAPPLEPSLDLVPGEEVKNALQILDTLVSILEGNQSNILFNKEIVPLLEKLQQTLRQPEQPLPQEFAEMLEEVMARMPQNEDMTQMPQKLNALANLTDTLRSYLCPPENVNENQNTAVTVEEAAYMPPVKPAAESTPFNGHSTDAEETFGKRQDSNSGSVPEGSSFHIAPARVAFGERFNAMAAQSAQPLTADNLFAAMVERIVSLPEAAPHMEISLKPDHLGKLSIDLQLSENGLTAKILASDEGVRNMLAAHINRLSDTLAERGIRVENVEVVYTALSDKSFDKQHSGDEQAQENSPQDSPIRLAEPLTALPQDNVYDLSLYADGLEWGVSSVEYRA